MKLFGWLTCTKSAGSQAATQSLEEDPAVRDLLRANLGGLLATRPQSRFIIPEYTAKNTITAVEARN